MTTRRRVFFNLAVLTAVVGAAFLTHHRLGRSDRITAARHIDELTLVRDQVLRFEADYGKLPASLDTLVTATSPRGGGYLRTAQLVRDGEPRYAFDPSSRSLRQTEGAIIRGVFAYRRPPVHADLPPVSGSDLSGSGRIDLPDHDPAPNAVRSTGIDISPSGPSEVPGLRLGSPFTTVGPEPLAPPPPGGLVFEAEHFSETNYGWEVTPEPEAGGGAVIHCKEGIANGPAQLDLRIGDFYNIHPTRDLTYLRYRIRIPEDGLYEIYARMWTTDTHCANNLRVAIDSHNRDASLDNRTPFRWVWTRMSHSPVRLSAGDRLLNLFIHEDGIRLDQFYIGKTPISGSEPFQANLGTGVGTAWRDDPATKPVRLLFDLDTRVLLPDIEPSIRIAVRALKPLTGSAELTVRLLGISPEDGPVFEGRGRLRLDDLPELAFVPVIFEHFNALELDRREYLLEASLRNARDIVMAKIRYPLVSPYHWETYGPLAYIPNGTAGPMDGDRQADPDSPHGWTPMRSDAWTPFGVLDFGLQTEGRSRNAPPHCTIYARTTIHVPRDGEYLVKMQSDDQMTVWIDGELFARIDANRPVTRSVLQRNVRLKAGEHRIRMRVNQLEGRWQSYLHFRSLDDGICGIAGVEPLLEPSNPTPKTEPLR